MHIHGSVHHNINLTEVTNKMRPCSRIYYSNGAGHVARMGEDRGVHSVGGKA
jgi:hypothetical protein